MNKTANLKQLTDYLIGLGAKEVVHTEKTYLAHVIGVYRLMEACGCTEELCLAGLFHSIYGTELFQRFGDRAMHLLALAQQELAVHSFSCQWMTEGKLVLRFFHHQLRGDQLFHQSQQFLFLMARDLLE